MVRDASTVVLVGILGATAAAAATVPNGGLLLSGLRSPELREELPIGFALDVSDRLEVCVHDREEAPGAFFSKTLCLSSDSDGDRPRALGPSISLFAPSLVEEGSLTDPLTLTIDAADSLFTALLQAAFELEILPENGPFARRIRERAGSVFDQVPADRRLETYVDATIAFASHALTVAVQIHRARLSHSERGLDLCRLLDHPANLLSLWSTIFTDAGYPGQYFLSRGEEGQQDGTWVTSRQVLEPQDKRLIVEHLLESRWTGDPANDFCSSCSTEAGPVQP